MTLGESDVKKKFKNKFRDGRKPQKKTIGPTDTVFRTFLLVGRNIALNRLEDVLNNLVSW